MRKEDFDFLGNRMFQEIIIKTVKQTLQQELEKLNLLKGDWHSGVVASVIDSKYLSVKVDGSDTAQTIPFNQSEIFTANDNVLVIFLNHDSKNKFVLCKKPV
jgi:hypothetical protein